MSYKDLGVIIDCRPVSGIKAGSPARDMVLVRPASELLGDENAVGDEPAWNHILCGMKLHVADGTTAEGVGQLLITGQRFIGMIDSGTATGGTAISLQRSADVFCIAFHRDDVGAPDIKKHRLTPSDFFFKSKERQAIAFSFTVYAAASHIANFKTHYWHDKNMLHVLSEEGRRGLLQG